MKAVLKRFELILLSHAGTHLEHRDRNRMKVYYLLCSCIFLILASVLATGDNH